MIMQSYYENSMYDTISKERLQARALQKSSCFNAISEDLVNCDSRITGRRRIQDDKLISKSNLSQKDRERGKK